MHDKATTYVVSKYVSRTTQSLTQIATLVSTETSVRPLRASVVSEQTFQVKSPCREELVLFTSPMKAFDMELCFYQLWTLCLNARWLRPRLRRVKAKGDEVG